MVPESSGGGDGDGGRGAEGAEPQMTTKTQDASERLNEAVRADAIVVAGPVSAADAEVLSPGALRFVASLSRRFEPERARLLEARRERQARLDAGERPDFIAETRGIRDSDWRVAPIPERLLDRRVEITGPVDRKMIINALNSGANVFMADFEDSHTPTWKNTVEGQINLRDAIAGTIAYRSPEGKEYALGSPIAALMVRPRGWHLHEKHVLVEGKPVSASLFDFGLHFFNNAAALLERGPGLFFYLPKLESRLEARLWNEVFCEAQDRLGIPRGTIRATVLIETILAAFEMDEILWELREHSGGLNCGRWDYIFSFIKKFRNDPACVLPDRAQVTMDRAFLKAYVDLLIRTCHRRGVHAMGGMAAQIPIRTDTVANQAALAKVRADKVREASAGHDGTWVAHPGLVPLAKAVFDGQMPGPNQIGVVREAVRVGPRELLAVHEGEITEAGLRHNVDVGLQYVETWLRGTGCVPIYNLMEDAATAEISRSQVWQWIRHGAKLADGRCVTAELVGRTIEEELSRLRSTVGSVAFHTGRYLDAATLFERMTMGGEFPEFLTLLAYEEID